MVKLFEQWESERDNTHLHRNIALAKLDIVEDLDVPLDNMRAESINFWLGKFVQEVRGQKGQRYRGRKLYQTIASLKRYSDGKWRTEINLLSNIDSR